jgi:hypothetical protein
MEPLGSHKGHKPRLKVTGTFVQPFWTGFAEVAEVQQNSIAEGFSRFWKEIYEWGCDINQEPQK